MERLILNLIFPVIVAVLGTQIWNWFLYRRNEKKEIYKKLYGPLKLYFSIMDSFEKTYKKINKEKSYDPSIKITIQWWYYLAQIVKLLKHNPEHIKEEHF